MIGGADEDRNAHMQTSHGTYSPWNSNTSCQSYIWQTGQLIRSRMTAIDNVAWIMCRTQGDGISMQLSDIFVLSRGRICGEWLEVFTYWIGCYENSEAGINKSFKSKVCR